MDFYIDIGVAALLRLLKDRRSAPRYFPALAKVHVQLDHLFEDNPVYQAAYRKQEEKTGVATDSKH